MSRLVKDNFGRRYIMRQSGDSFIPGVSAERFSDTESALRFIRYLDVPHDFWLRLVHDVGASIHHSKQSHTHNIEDAAARLLHQGRIAFYPCHLPDNFTRPPTFWPGWQQGGFSYSYAPCEVTLLHRNLTTHKLTREQQAQQFITTAGTDTATQRQLLLASGTRAAADMNASDLKQHFIQRLLSGHLIIIKQIIPRPHVAEPERIAAGPKDRPIDDVGATGGELSATQVMPVKNSLRQSVTPNEATVLFDKAKADTKIPFDYPLDCCYSRAHEMCRQFETEGVECRKAWNYASPGNSLRADTSKNAVTPSGYVEWRYHVAPLLAVKQPDGSVLDHIIDPSLHDGPVPVDVWKSRMNDAGSIFKTTDSKPYYQSADGSHKLYDTDYSETNNMLKEHGRTRDSLTSSTTGK